MKCVCRCLFMCLTGLALSTGIISLAVAQQDPSQASVIQSEDAIEIRIPTSVVPGRDLGAGAQNMRFDPLTYTLGADDLVEIGVLRHPEFSGVYPINSEGKLQYKFVGDIDVNGLTKSQLEEKLRDILKAFVNNPVIDVTVIEYRSKVFYVLGDVSAPGKYYMRAESITVREALFESGLPTTSAAMRKCRIITPRASGKPKVRKVNVYEILYGGNLRKNVLMQPGDVLYVPSTIMAKLLRMINPVASTVGVASSPPGDVSGGKRAVETLQGRP